jgi:hypothetical protein
MNKFPVIYSTQCKILQLWLGRDAILKNQHTWILSRGFRCVGFWGLHPSQATTAISLDKIRLKANEDRTSKLVDRYILKYKKRCLMPADIFSPLKPAPLRRSRHETKKTKYITEEVVLEHVKLVSVQVPFRSSVHDPTSKLLHSD